MWCDDGLEGCIITNPPIMKEWHRTGVYLDLVNAAAEGRFGRKRSARERRRSLPNSAGKDLAGRERRERQCAMTKIIDFGQSVLYWYRRTSNRPFFSRSNRDDPQKVKFGALRTRAIHALLPEDPPVTNRPW